MSNRLLVGCALVQAAAAILFILSFFGITSAAFKGSTVFAVLGVLLFLGSLISLLYSLYRTPSSAPSAYSTPSGSTPSIIIPTPTPSSTPPTISPIPTPSSTPSTISPTPFGVVPVATDSAPIILNRDNPIATVRVGVGDYREFVCEGITVRISVKGLITNYPQQPLAILNVDSGGGLIYGGNRTKEDGVNQYHVPAAQFGYDEPYSVHFYNVLEAGKYFRFFRAYVEHINSHAGQVTLNVFSFRYDGAKRI